MDKPQSASTIQLFVSSNDPLNEKLDACLKNWSEGRADVEVELVPVLGQPESVVRLQIFYTPALVIDGRLVAGGIKSTSDLMQFLPD